MANTIATKPATSTTARTAQTPAPASNPANPSPAAVTKKVFNVSTDNGKPQIVPVDDAAVPAADANTGTDAAVETTAPLGFFNENMSPLPEGKYGFRPLTKSEMDELAADETVVRENIPKFLAVGLALLNIRTKKLWRLYCRSWNEYLDKRVGLSPQYASMQASAAEVMQNLLTSGEQIVQPTTERQLRPLVGLPPKDQITVWNRAVEKSGDRKVTGKAVEESIIEVLGDEVSPQDWLTKVRNKLVAAGFETDFQQPVDLGEKTWIDLLHEKSGVFVKLIDQPTLSNLATCLAMKDRGVKYQVIVNSGSIPKKKLEKGRNNALSRLLDPVLSVYLHSLNALVECDGQLYEAATLGDDFKLELKPSDSDDANDLRLALAPQPAPATDEGQE